MGKWTTITICSIVCLWAGTAFAGEKAVKAHADIIDASGRTIGTAVLTEQHDGVQVRLKVAGLTPGKHGLHFHETGVCTPSDFKSAGGHFNPFHKHHGINSPAGRHLGDLPNLEVQQNGTADVTVLAPGASLGKMASSLLKEGGTALVIHAQPDDNVSDPAGNAGARVACGVIRGE